MQHSRFSFFISACFTGGILAALWTPIFCLYGAELWRVPPTRVLEALPLAPVPRALFWNTFFLCIATVFLALFLGVVVAAFLAGREKWGGPAIIFALPLAVSPTLMATAYLEISRTPPLRAAASLGAESTLSINSIFIAAPVLALCFYPLIAFAVGAARRAIPLELLDAARLFGNDWLAWRRVLQPLLAPAAFAAAGIVAALSMWEMGAPDLLDVRTYSVQIYRDFSAQQNTEKAALDALPMLLFGALCFLPTWRALRFYKGFETLAAGENHAGTRSKIPALAAFFIFALSPLAPLWVFATQMQSLRILRTVWEVNRAEISNTLIVATTASTLILAIGLALSTAWREYSTRTQHALLMIALGSLLCAPVMQAVAYLAFYNSAFFGFLYDSRYGLLLLGLTARLLPPGVLWLHEALRRIPKNYEEAGANLGATRARVLQTITLPLLAPAALGIFAVSWALGATELSLSVLLNAPGGQTLPVPIFNQMHIGATAEAAALSLILVALNIGVLGAPFLLWRWMQRRVNNRN